MRRVMLALLLLTGVAAADDETQSLAAIERQVFDAVNEHRRSQGLGALSANETLAKAAREHSRAMAAGRVDFGHDGFHDRAQRVGKSFPLRAMAENISKHKGRSSDLAQVALAWWLASPKHRKNLEGDFDASGLAAARSETGTLYLTQIFAARRR